MSTHTGVMIALYPAADVAEALARPGGEAVADLHLTLAYLGDVDQCADVLPRLPELVTTFAADAPALDGTIAGLGLFNTLQDDGRLPLYASVDLPLLAAFRERLVAVLEQADVAFSQRHGFTPHITLAYVAPDDHLELDTLTPLRLRFESLWLVIGTERTAFPLVAARAANWGARAQHDGSIPHGLERPITIKSEVEMEQLAIKATGAWTLEVLGCPYYGPHKGKDSQGEFFSPRTNFREDLYPLPPVVHYHGFDDSGRPAGEPEFIGKSTARHVRSDGVWYAVDLDPEHPRSAQMMDAAHRRTCRASSGSIAHLRRVDGDGHIRLWPVVELSLLDAVGGRQPINAYAVALPVAHATYKAAGLVLPDEEEPAMTQEEIQAMIAAAIKADRVEQAAAATAAQAEQNKIDAAVAAAKASWEREAAPGRRLVDGGAPYVARFGETRRYDNLDAGEQALLVAVLGDAKRRGISRDGASDGALKALAIKLVEDESSTGSYGQAALKAAGLPIKANELMQANLAGFGDEWVGTAYSEELWKRIRVNTWVADKLRGIEIPQGRDSMDIPTEGAGFTFYRVGEAANTGTNGRPDATVISSKSPTGKVTLKPQKLGARAIHSEEMEEDSLIPFIGWLRDSLVQDGAECLEHVLIDGDMALGATTNINHIGGTPAGNEAYTTFDGLRKLALVINSSNARAGAALVDADFLLTMQLMGAAGINALDPEKLCFLLDPSLHYKALQLPAVKTRDVNAAATIERGKLVSIYGVDVKVSAQLCRASGNRLTNASGKIDLTTPTNNTKSTLICVRWDQLVLGWKRMMKIETGRIPSSDASEIVATMRVDMKPRDSEAVGLTYNLS